MSNHRKHKHLTKSEQKSIDRKELFRHLLPLIKSFGVWIVLVAIMATDYASVRWLSEFFVQFTTQLTILLSKVLFVPVKEMGVGANAVLSSSSGMLLIAGYPLEVGIECTAYHAYFALIALVLFSAWKLKDKLLYGVVILIVLAILNSLRIVFLGVIGDKFPALLHVMHDYIWNILLVIILWGLWEFSNKKLTKTK
ncbi:MAG: exosortase/archaeosortase family protein [Draconibacterium sp.]